MATLNITYNGQSADCPIELDGTVSDADVRRIAVELVSSGGFPGLPRTHLRDDAFNHYVFCVYATRKDTAFALVFTGQNDDFVVFTNLIHS